ncbi:MAG: hypothetical protein K0R41_3740 [Geminicoccaceae bacterium]|nr:hypothetical protein [Geminicoccaceae bacterium]
MSARTQREPGSRTTCVKAKQLRVQVAEGEAEDKDGEQRQDRPVDGPAQAVVERVDRQREHQQGLVEAPFVADRGPAPEQLRADRERGEREQEEPGGLAPAEPGQERQQRAGERQRERGREPAEARGQACRIQVWSERAGMAERRQSGGSTLSQGVRR